MPPRIELNIAQIEKLAALGCTTQEIATVMKCSKDTLERNYMSVLEDGRAKMRMSLRRMQISAANEGSAAMMIWLGKQYLDQKDKREETVDFHDRTREIQAETRRVVDELSGRRDRGLTAVSVQDGPLLPDPDSTESA